MVHSPGFLKAVNEARPRVKEITIAQARERFTQNPRAILLDVREDSEWSKQHAAQATHLGRGILERDLEEEIPDVGTEIIMYCGGGYRSILAADSAQKMGYRNVVSLIGGYRGMVEAGWPMETGGLKRLNPPRCFLRARTPAAPTGPGDGGSRCG